MRRFTAVWDDFLIEKMKEPWQRPCLNRFQIVQRAMLEKKNKKVPSKIHDKYITHLKAVMTALRDHNMSGHRAKVLSERFAAYAAWDFWNRNRPGDARWRIEAYIMAGATNEQLLKKFPTQAGVEAFEYFRKLFFDIAAYEDNDDLMMINVINAAYDRPNNMECDLLWKIAARRYANLEDVTQFINKDICGLEKGLQQTLREIQQSSLMNESARLTLKPSEMDERSILTTSLASTAMFISHDDANKIAEIAFQEKVGKVVDHLSIKLIKSSDPLPENAAGIKQSADIHHARAEHKANAKQKLAEAKEAEQRMRRRYQVMEVD